MAHALTAAKPNAPVGAAPPGPRNAVPGPRLGDIVLEPCVWDPPPPPPPRGAAPRGAEHPLRGTWQWVMDLGWWTRGLHGDRCSSMNLPPLGFPSLWGLGVGVGNWTADSCHSLKSHQTIPIFWFGASGTFTGEVCTSIQGDSERGLHQHLVRSLHEHSVKICTTIWVVRRFALTSRGRFAPAFRRAVCRPWRLSGDRVALPQSQRSR